MAKIGPVYQRLTRPASSVGSYQSLWLGDDHLLLVTSTGYTEEYRRIRLRDIKGILMISSHRRLWWALPWAIVGAIFLIPLIMAASSGEISWPGAIGVGTMLVLLAWNHLLGPGCHAYVVTGVQTAPLPALVRWRKARKVLDRIRPPIEAAQSGIEQESSAAPVSIPPPLP